MTFPPEAALSALRVADRRPRLGRPQPALHPARRRARVLGLPQGPRAAGQRLHPVPQRLAGPRGLADHLRGQQAQEVARRPDGGRLREDPVSLFPVPSLARRRSRAETPDEPHAGTSGVLLRLRGVFKRSKQFPMLRSLFFDEDKKV